MAAFCEQIKADEMTTFLLGTGAGLLAGMAMDRLRPGFVSTMENIDYEYEESFQRVMGEMKGEFEHFLHDNRGFLNLEAFGRRSTFNKQIVLDGLKNADVEYKLNPNTGQMEPYMKQFKLNDDYKVLLRKDFGDFNHNDPLGNHWNLEVQTTKGRTVYDLHIYMDDAGDILPITDDNIYIPSRSPFNN